MPEVVTVVAMTNGTKATVMVATTALILNR